METLAPHKPVLLAPTVEFLVHKPDGVYVDCTFGRGGHSRAVLQHLGPAGRLVALDRDPEAVLAMQSIEDPRFVGVDAAFAGLDAVCSQLGLQAVDGVLMDVGVSSPQIDSAERGFSFRQNGPLDMRMDPRVGETAAAFVANATVQELSKVLRDYGEERFAVSIAKAIVARREKRPIVATLDLAEIVAGAVRTREAGQNPATRTFQALRIFVNQELAQLEQGLAAAYRSLAVGGRLVVISFHSLEDRLVKNFINTMANPRAQQDPRVRKFPGGDVVPSLKKIARVKPDPAECAANPRARSAVLRVAERLALPMM